MNPRVKTDEFDPNILPEWTPNAVRVVLQRFYVPGIPQEHADILRRLATDQRTCDICSQLTKRKRPSREFCYPAKLENYPSLTTDQLQDEALAQTFHFAFCSARDRRASLKYSEIEQRKQELLNEAEILRRVANDLILSAAQPAHSDSTIFLSALTDANALRRVAAWRERLVDDLAPQSDPHIAINERGDPLARGVQIDIAAFFQNMFGDELNGIAAELTGVVLGRTGLSPRVSRSAFSRPK